ncbi:MAG TPA: small multi-drug export protein [bacterium]|nr:small multi-drug export protein [bacterium]
MSLFMAILTLIGITFLPFLELRASIPFGFFHEEVSSRLSWPAVATVCVAANILIGWATFWILAPAANLMRRWGWFDRAVWPKLEKTQHRIKPKVDRWGEWGVAIFIGVPLPGSGTYAGALGAYLLGLSKRKFAAATVIGVLIAGAAVTAFCLLIEHGFVADDSIMRKLMVKEIG